jgi:class 3 adenylate cyclase
MDAMLITVRVPERQPFTVVLDRRLGFGREGENVVVTDPQVSRRHIAVQPGPERTVLVTDLGSANGTTIDGIAAEGPTQARSGSVIRIGSTTLEIRDDHAEPRAAERTLLAGSGGQGRRTSVDVVAEAVSESISARVLGVEDEAGTLTIVFSDIESSTELAVALGDRAWLNRLRQHHKLVSAHVVAHRGRIVKHQGDGYMLCFRSARGAILTSIGLQRDLEREAEAAPATAIRVRLGLHTGEVLVGDGGDLFGRHVVVAARIAALAQGGEILVSSLVRQIAEARGDLLFVDTREVELRGIGASQSISGVDWRAFGSADLRDVSA